MAPDTSTDAIESVQHSAVLRLLTGPMRGCEFTLTEGVTLFVIGPSDPAVDRGWQADMPPNAIYVPMDGEGDNFEVLVDHDDRPGLFVRVLSDVAGREVAIDATQIAEIGDVCIGVRRVNEPWSTHVSRSMCAQRGPSDAVQHSVGRRRWQQMFWGTLLLAVLAGGVWFYVRSAPQRQAEGIAEYLETIGGRAQVLPGTDGMMYVLTEDSAQRLSLTRILGAAVIQREGLVVLALDEENERITQWIDASRNQVPYFKLYFDDPAAPELWVGKQHFRLSEHEATQFRSLLHEKMPYAKRVSIVPHDEADASNEAEDALKRQMVPFLRTDTPEGVTFHISAELDDVQLRRLYSFMQSFAKRWGTKLVRFNVDLRDDWTGQKSYAYGTMAYIKEGPHQWQFVNRQ
ncbi:PrgH/EprH family type III secretion apparatus protein [Pandoraea norimbergensis]|uniref:Type III secretion system protein PrgH n=1 Tax=Pandoraea norimbergensis TaxID=93219 RepID=A0ABM5WHM7_9BURK|nr:PrgH/EprH family type III secretion apparatus protein [Pandoraea norimbergensis]ALS59868.1 hypothetical protein AT302_08975 [Pandoraea norimbergensis]